MSKNQIQQQIVESIPKPAHGILLLSPRLGKSKIGIDVIKKEKPKKVLWVTPNRKLRDEDIPAEFKKWKALKYLDNTDIICYASLAEHEGVYDKVILDEYQDITEANSLPLFNGNIKYKSILALSGTHPKHKEKLDIYRRLNLSILSEISIDQAVEKGLIAPYKINVVECELDRLNKNVKSGNSTKVFYQTEQEKYDYLTKLIRIKNASGQIVPKFYYLNRMRFIYNLKSKTEFAKKLLSKLEGRTLIFTGSISQAEELCKYTYHSKTDDKHYNMFQKGKIDSLACVNSGGVGSTYVNVDNFVIVQVNSDTKGDATQKIARSLVLQEGYTANIYILCVKDTVDEDWKDKVIKGFNPDNINHISYKLYE